MMFGWCENVRKKRELKIKRLLNLAGGYGVATGGPLAWGLCYNKEMSPSKDYCDDDYKYTYPCTPGVEYFGRGALPLYWYDHDYPLLQTILLP